MLPLGSGRYILDQQIMTLPRFWIIHENDASWARDSAVGSLTRACLLDGHKHYLS